MLLSILIEHECVVGDSKVRPPMRQFLCISEQDAVTICRELYELDAVWLKEKSDDWIFKEIKNNGLFISLSNWKWIKITINEQKHE